MVSFITLVGMLLGMCGLRIEGSLSARVIGTPFPALYFQRISTRALNEALGFGDLWLNHLILAGFTMLFRAFAALLLNMQEA